jgi:type III secretion protein U
MGMRFDEAIDLLLRQLVRDAAMMLLPFLLIVIGLGLFIELLQTGMLFSFKALMPSGKKINVANNVKNIFSKKNLIEFLKSNVKIIVLSAILYSVLRNEIPTLLTLPRADLLGVGVAIGILLKAMLIKITVGYFIIAAADFAFQRQQYVKGLMMSKDEVKQEYKEAEGDPHIKHQRRQLHQEMAQEGAVTKTREASVVVTNPTHLAIAIKYDKVTAPLPVVLAKGEGLIAERMVDAARQASIPILQNIPLAWALMETADIDRYIPRELLEPVAEVLRMVQDMREDEESQ